MLPGIVLEQDVLRKAIDENETSLLKGEASRYFDSGENSSVHVTSIRNIGKDCEKTIAVVESIQKQHTAGRINLDASEWASGECFMKIEPDGGSNSRLPPQIHVQAGAEIGRSDGENIAVKNLYEGPAQFNEAIPFLDTSFS